MQTVSGEWLSGLKFGDRGLIPAIVQDYATQEVLTLAYMSRESLEITLREGFTCFYSRSRQCLWRKGETSGNTQRVVSVTPDCDGDALLVRVKKAGPACHTGAESCFHAEGYRNEEIPPFSLFELAALIEGRKLNPREGSYTSYLFAKGREKILKKVGEESAEVLIAGAKGSREETVFEIADLAYHLLALMTEMGISPEDILRELAGRHVIDHKVKQETLR